MAETLGGLLSSIQRIMLEDSIDQGATWSSLWTAAEVIHYLNQRLSRFLLETEIVQDWVVTPVPGATLVVDLPSDLLVLKRLAVVSNTTVVTKIMISVDRWQTDLAGVPSLDGDRPTVYVLEPRPPLSFVPLPAPVEGQSYDIVYVPNPATFTTGSSKGTSLPLPDCFAPYIMFGVLADMFSKEGEANDPDRASYFGERWDEGIELGKMLLR